MWALEAGAEPRPAHQLRVPGLPLGAAFSPDASLLAVGTTDAQVHLWRMPVPDGAGGGGEGVAEELPPLTGFDNYVYGLTDIPLRTYVLVTLPSMLPATIAYNFAAGALRTGNLGKTLWYLGIAAVFFVLLSLIPGWVRKRHGGHGLSADA